jgi:hypothetical protein
VNTAGTTVDDEQDEDNKGGYRFPYADFEKYRTKPGRIGAKVGTGD